MSGHAPPAPPPPPHGKARTRTACPASGVTYKAIVALHGLDRKEAMAQRHRHSDAPLRAAARMQACARGHVPQASKREDRTIHVHASCQHTCRGCCDMSTLEAQVKRARHAAMQTPAEACMEKPPPHRQLRSMRLHHSHSQLDASIRDQAHVLPAPLALPVMREAVLDGGVGAQQLLARAAHVLDRLPHVCCILAAAALQLLCACQGVQA